MFLKIRFATARAFDFAALFFTVETALARCAGRAGGLARFRLVAGFAYQREQPFQRVGAVAALQAKALRGNGDHAVRGNAVAGECYQAFAHVVRQRRRVPSIKLKLHGRRNLVDVLPAGAGGTHEGFFDFRFLQNNIARDANHVTDSLR